MSLVENNVYMERVHDGARDVDAIRGLFRLIISCFVDNVLEK
jgi:hypothetical protein